MECRLRALSQNERRASVLVVSPYLDEHLVDCLRELREQGVLVDLVVMEDFTSYKGSKMLADLGIDGDEF